MRWTSASINTDRVLMRVRRTRAGCFGIQSLRKAVRPALNPFGESPTSGDPVLLFDPCGVDEVFIPFFPEKGTHFLLLLDGEGEIVFFQIALEVSSKGDSFGIRLAGEKLEIQWTASGMKKSALRLQKTTFRFFGGEKFRLLAHFLS